MLHVGLFPAHDRKHGQRPQMLSKLVSLKQTEGAASTFALTTPLMETVQKN